MYWIPRIHVVFGKRPWFHSQESTFLAEDPKFSPQTCCQVFLPNAALRIPEVLLLCAHSSWMRHAYILSSHPASLIGGEGLGKRMCEETRPAMAHS